MRIGYFGGTFDPPHRGHLAVATAAARAFALDRVLLAPTGRQPLKGDAAVAPWADRLAMVRLLCAAAAGAGIPLSSPFVAGAPVAEGFRLQASELDAPHADGTPNYTVDALEKLHAEEPAAELFCIVGADSLLSLPHWREPQRLLELAQWIAVARPGFELDSLALSPEQRARIHLLPGDDDTSATAIRERLRYGVSPGDRLTPEVMLYIARMLLYHPGEPPRG